MITRSLVLRAFLGEHKDSSVTAGCAGRGGGEVLHGLVSGNPCSSGGFCFVLFWFVCLFVGLGVLSF